ncbi:hypothetical protein [Sphingomonas sp. DT-204]|uniref:hypothetical protein n=1 Tax=Sphingomonas sp. DT-204 TaxID=3396166 RepID=UPI003F1D45E6
MDEDLSDLVALLREEERPADDAFVSDVEWLIELDLAFERRRRSTLRRWAVDLGSAGAVGCVAYVLANNAPAELGALSMMFSAPLLAATAVPVLWLLARSATAPT